MKRLRSTGSVALIAVLVVAAGCGSDNDGERTSTAAVSTASAAATATTSSVKAPKIAYITQVVPSDFNTAQEKGINQVVQPLGGGMKFFSANYDPQKLMSLCKDAISTGNYNGIALQVLDPASGVPCVKLAHAAGIPVVALDGAIGTDPNSLAPQVEGVVGSIVATPKDNAATSVELATRACAGIDPCNIIVELASPTDPMTNQAADELATKVPNAKVVAKFVSGFDPAVVSQKMPDLLAAHKDANVFVSVADTSALAALPAIAKAGLTDQIKVIGDGGSFEGAKAIADGTLYGSTGNWPIQEGAIAATMIKQALNGEPVEPEGIEQDLVDKPRLLDKDNIAQYKPEWGAGS